MSKSSKGAAWERKICTELSSWWTDGERTDVFWRSSGSGARAKVRGRKGKSTYGQSGDIAAIDPIGDPLIKFLTLELKRGYSRFTLFDLLDKPTKAAQQMYETWIEQAEESHTQAGSYAWLIMFKRDKRASFVLYPQCLGEALAKWTDIDNVYPKISTVIKLPNGLTYIDGTTLSEFLRVVSANDIKRLARDF